MKKEFVSAILPSESLQYKLHIVIFGIVPVAMVLGFFQALRVEDFRFSFLTVLLMLVFLLLGSLLATMFYFFRKYSPYKIITDQTSLYYSGLLKRVHVRWDQVQSFGGVPDGIIGRRFIELKTRNDKLYISMLMKEKDNPYPKLGVVSHKWINADGTEAQVCADSCPLYKEIQEHLKGRI